MSRLSFFQDLLAGFTERGRGPNPQSGRRNASLKAVIAGCDKLLSNKGEASGVVIAGEVLANFRSLGEADKLAFFETLATRYAPDPAEVQAASDAYAKDQGPEALEHLRKAAEPPRQELFRRLNLAHGGTATLVALRRELLRHLKDKPSLKSVDADLEHLFESWFNRGFLVLKRIDWQTPANILEKIIQYEAVHEIHGWDDLRSRIEPADRRCFAFFHPALGDEPLIFVEVALTDHIPDNILEVLRDDREILSDNSRTVAVFYSISNCQEGLRGVSFGNFLIKQVVEDLKGGLPSLKTFVTLSPVPGFRTWLERAAQSDEDRADLSEAVDLIGRPNWHTDEAMTTKARGHILPLAAEYFLAAARPDGLPVDPVARFHLGNGASLEQINWLGDRSSKGLNEAAGLMVNYLYDIPSIEANHEAYADDGRVIASRKVRSLLPSNRTRRQPVPAHG